MRDTRRICAVQAEHFRYHESNNVVAVSTLDLFISNVPCQFQESARWAVYALMEPFLLKTMGLPQVRPNLSPVTRESGHIWDGRGEGTATGTRAGRGGVV